MKTLPLSTNTYKHQVKRFTKWLEDENHSERTVEQYNFQIREFFYYLENTAKITEVKKISSGHIVDFQQYLTQRKNLTHGGGLSANHINGIVKTVMQYLKFIKLIYGHTVICEVQRVKEKSKVPDVLTQKEIKQLFDSIDVSEHSGIMTKAIIALLYGAGLRKSELEKLQVDDISFEECLVHIREGKGRKGRFIPVPAKILEYVYDYIKEVRDVRQKHSEETCLFLSAWGKPIRETIIYTLVKGALENSGIKNLNERKVSLHTLRHSIATHLLQKGMELEDIARFLGHSTLDSTMVYTHIINNL